MIAIYTKFLPATETQPGRIKAYTVGNPLRKSISTTITKTWQWNYEMEHFEAVKALVEKHNLDWDLSDMRYGDSSDGRGYVFCFAKSIVGK